VDPSRSGRSSARRAPCRAWSRPISSSTRG
jgi:hypothetical protein